MIIGSLQSCIILQSGGPLDEGGSKWRSNGLFKSKVFNMSSFRSYAKKDRSLYFRVKGIQNVTLESVSSLLISMRRNISSGICYGNSYMWSSMTLLPLWHYSSNCRLKMKMSKTQFSHSLSVILLSLPGFSTFSTVCVLGQAVEGSNC